MASILEERGGPEIPHSQEEAELGTQAHAEWRSGSASVGAPFPEPLLRPPTGGPPRLAPLSAVEGLTQRETGMHAWGSPFIHTPTR